MIASFPLFCPVCPIGLTFGTPCTVCTAVCSERIDMHDADGAIQLGDCTRCGECAKACPTGSITFALKAQGEDRPAVAPTAEESVAN